MKRVLLIGWFVLGISNYFYAQNTLGVVYYEKRKVSSFYEEIKEAESKTYTTSEWIGGSMILKDSTFVDPANFKYDAKNDRFEVRLVVDPRTVDKIVMGGKFFIYSVFINEFNYEQFSYFEILNDGNAKILRRKYVKKVPKRSGAYGNESYSAIGEKLYLKVGNKPAIEIKNSNSLLQSQFDYKSEVSDFIKIKKLNLGKKRDLVKLVKYYNTLK